MYNHILIPTDGSESARRAVIAGVKLAKSLAARVTFVTVMLPFATLPDHAHAYAGLPEPMRQQAFDYLSENAGKALEAAVAVARAEDISADAALVESASPDKGILQEAANRSADAIVIGSHGRRGIEAVLLGSVTQKVLAGASVPVLVYR
ncbi:MAG: universal stress protein [Hyphomicrobiaceae bacterium]